MCHPSSDPAAGERAAARSERDEVGAGPVGVNRDRWTRSDPGTRETSTPGHRGTRH